ncbi:MAG: hypothetical protein AMXMBFR13_48490, partial [Phycisphaerae bacterium]
LPPAHSAHRPRVAARLGSDGRADTRRAHSTDPLGFQCLGQVR